MKVSDILRVKGSTLFTVSPEQSLAEAAQTMAEHDIGSLVVMSGGELVGMLTFREVIKAVVKAGGVVGGEVRSVPNLEQRLHEAERIGFERAVIPKHSLNHLSPADYPGMQLIGAAYITDAINALKSDRL